MLQETIKKMPEDEAKYHLERCVKSGLWVPDASKVDNPDASTVDDEAKVSSEPPTDADNGAAASSSTVPNVSTDDVD